MKKRAIRLAFPINYKDIDYESVPPTCEAKSTKEETSSQVTAFAGRK